jgi:diketogulonate reductase-like aldo/keto reductase
MNKTIQSTNKLNDGVEIPILGLGTFLSRGEECANAVEYALNHGYSHIDTAQMYHNEHQVGSGWKASKRSRKDIFITTKISNENQGYEKTKKSFEKSLKDLQTDYVDLLLIHWPNMEDFDRTIETWRAMVELQVQGRTRSIGVSNFTSDLIEKLMEKFDVIPAVNQVEFHAFLYQKDLLAYSQAKDIQVEAYSPIARAKMFDHPGLQNVVKKHDKTPAQVMLAWLIHHDLVVIPKSIHPKRIDENADIFFDLDNEDLAILDNLEPQVRLVNDTPWKMPNW